MGDGAPGPQAGPRPVRRRRAHRGRDRAARDHDARALPRLDLPATSRSWARSSPATPCSRAVRARPAGRSRRSTRSSTRSAPACSRCPATPRSARATATRRRSARSCRTWRSGSCGGTEIAPADSTGALPGAVDDAEKIGDTRAATARLAIRGHGQGRHAGTRDRTRASSWPTSCRPTSRVDLRAPRRRWPGSTGRRKGAPGSPATSPADRASRPCPRHCSRCATRKLLIYLDTSAFLKTMFDEPQSSAIRTYLEAVDSPRFVSSTLLAVEARRGALRANPRRLPRVDLALLRVAQIEMDGPVVETASRLPDPMLRSLDAIHLATALLIRQRRRGADELRPAHAARPRPRPRPAHRLARLTCRAVPDADFPADPYPGAVPPFSFVHLDEHSHPLTFDGCWRVGGAGAAELDLWLAGHGAPPLAARVPLLSYGSNRNPGKITWLRRALGLTGPVVVLRARTDGLAAVWASGFRARDGQRTSVLGAAPGASEQHAVWLATPEQVAVLDRCEGRGDRYRLARLGTGAVYTDDGLRIEAPWCYLGLSAIRRPLLVDGHPVRCADARPGRGAATSTACRRRTTGCRPPPCTEHRSPTSGPPRCSSTGRCSRGSRRGRCSRDTRSDAPRRSHGGRARVRHRARLPGPAPRQREPCTRVARHAASGARSPGSARSLRGRRVPADPRRGRDRRRDADRLLDLRLDGRRRRFDPGSRGMDCVIEVSQHETPVTVGAT